MRLQYLLVAPQLAFAAGTVNCNAVSNVVNALKVVKTASAFCTKFNKITTVTTTTTTTLTSTDSFPTCSLPSKKKKRRALAPTPLAPPEDVEQPAQPPVTPVPHLEARDPAPLPVLGFCNGAPIPFACNFISSACSCLAKTPTKTITSTQQTTTTTTTITGACVVPTDTCPVGVPGGTTCGFNVNFDAVCYCLKKANAADSRCVDLDESVDPRRKCANAQYNCASGGDAYCESTFGGGWECMHDPGPCDQPVCARSGTCRQEALPPF